METYEKIINLFLVFMMIYLLMFGANKMCKNVVYFFNNMNKKNVFVNFLVGMIILIIAVWFLYFKDEGYLFLWIKYLFEIINTYLCSFVRCK